MKSTRAITVGLTFIAGLYFILDFVVPPTMPLASIKGVVASTSPAAFGVQSNGLPTVGYRMAGQGALRPHLFVEQRDVLGNPTPVATLLRQLGVGATVTVRLGPFNAKAVIPGQASTVETSDGVRVSLSPGQKWIDAATSTPVALPAAGMNLIVEQAGGRLVSKNPGSAVLVIGGKRVTHPLGDRSAILKEVRSGQGAEVPLDELRAGDTARIGPATQFADNRDAAAQFNLVITTMAFGIGLLSLGSVHSKILIKRESGWYLSLFFFAAVVLGIAAGFGKYGDPGTSGREFSDFVVLRLIASVTSTVFSLLAFYMASAAYRAFRIRNREAALMMVSALIVMVGQTPFGYYLTSWMGERYSALWLPNIAAWILRVPNTAVFRGLIFGIMLGAIATALRYWLSMEKSVT